MSLGTWAPKFGRRAHPPVNISIQSPLSSQSSPSLVNLGCRPCSSTIDGDGMMPLCQTQCELWILQNLGFVKGGVAENGKKGPKISGNGDTSCFKDASFCNMPVCWEKGSKPLNEHFLSFSLDQCVLDLWWPEKLKDCVSKGLGVRACHFCCNKCNVWGWWYWWDPCTVWCSFCLPSLSLLSCALTTHLLYNLKSEVDGMCNW